MLLTHERQEVIRLIIEHEMYNQYDPRTFAENLLKNGYSGLNGLSDKELLRMLTKISKSSTNNWNAQNWLGNFYTDRVILRE